jgi:DNA processing protein
VRASASDWRNAGARVSPVVMPKLDAEPVLRAVSTLDMCGAHVVAFADSAYPPRLREIPDPPPFLFVRGAIAPCHQHMLAIVGARRASGYGKRIAEHLAMALSEAGFIIVSGLALGVDAAAHQGALRAHQSTVAVTACGPERIYPYAHQSLAGQILEHGALVTEFAPGTAPLPGHFPRRNRIISGLSLGVIVVEAGVRSGSLITARLALEQGREVFAVPGAVTNPLAHGTHQLLREGARLVADANDVLEELAPQLERLPVALRSADEARLSAVARCVLNELKSQPSSADMLAGAGFQDIREVTSALEELALKGLVVKQFDGHWCIR